MTAPFVPPLRALRRETGQPLVIVAVDNVSYLCVDRDGDSRWIDHGEIVIPFTEDWELIAWFEVGGQIGDSGAGSDSDLHAEGAQSEAVAPARAGGPSGDDLAEPDRRGTGGTTGEG